MLTINNAYCFEQHALVLPIRQGEILLGLKKKGLGKGNWVGFGGKVEPKETFEQAAIRELFEESGLHGSNLTCSGVLELNYPHAKTYIKAHVFYTNSFSGEFCETDEMLPRWFNISEIPFSKMWPDDKLWMPLMLSGKKFEANFYFHNFDSIADYSIEEML